MSNNNAVTDNNQDPRWKDNPLQFRIVPHGPPKTRDNECNNPGRQKFTSESTESMYEETNWRAIWIDKMREINQSSVWQSGPTDNNKLQDFFVDGCGFWTSPGGNNTDWDNVGGNPHKFAAVTSAANERLNSKLLYMAGTGKEKSKSNAGMEYGVTGMTGYFFPDWMASETFNPKSLASIGLRHVYVCYRSDAEDEYINDLSDAAGLLWSGTEKLFDLGTQIFPEFMSGKLDVDIENHEFADTFTCDFPENFDVRSYFKDNAQRNPADIINEEVMEDLLSQRFPDNEGSRFVCDYTTEQWNIAVNKIRGVKGADKFTIAPDAIRNLLSDKGSLSILDILSWLVSRELPEGLDEMLPNGIDIEKLYNQYSNDGASIYEIVAVLNGIKKGGYAYFNEDIGLWEARKDGYDYAITAFNPYGSFSLIIL